MESLTGVMTGTIRKDQLEAKIKEEKELIRNGELREENPLDLSPEFEEFLQACRRGDLKRCQEMISSGININGKDQFDYTPLIIVSLPITTINGHLMLTSGLG